MVNQFTNYLINLPIIFLLVVEIHFVVMENMIDEICQGLSLTASVLVGLLCNNEKHEWKDIHDSYSLGAHDDDLGENNIKKILKLSYVSQHEQMLCLLCNVSKRFRKRTI